MLTVVDLLLPHLVSRSYSDSDSLFDASRRDAEAETTHCLWLVGGCKREVRAEQNTTVLGERLETWQGRRT